VGLSRSRFPILSEGNQDHGPGEVPPRSRRSDEVQPLAESKLAAPRLRAELVDRPRILKALDAGEGAALTLVSAPPGYGKTTAVRAWCANRRTAPAWVTLDEGDNDAVRLWMYVATAVDRIREGLGRPALQRLRLPGMALETALDELANGIASFGEELVVVLDDLQTVTDEECLATIDYFVERLPTSARLVVVTRVDPALRLPRLRVRGGLAELRASELAFTSSEARELIVEHGGIDLAAQEIEVLQDRTEGWPAALSLAALWLRAVDDAGRSIREFGGDQRFVAEYLSHEVLGSLGDDLRSFMLRTSVLGRFTAQLCDAVLDRRDSAAVLAELERSNLFVTRLEHGGWFRVHALFAEFAVTQLASVEPGAEIAIRRRAAAWLRSRRLPVEAADHAAAAGDHELVAQLLAEYHLVLIRSGGAGTLLRWVRGLPDEQLLEHPELLVAAATAATMIGYSTLERRRYLQLASRARRERPARFNPYVEAVAHMVRAAAIDGDVGQAVLDGRQAVELAEAGADDVLVAALAGYARALYFAGRVDEAWAAAMRAVEHPDAERRAPGHAFARSTVALAAVDRGAHASARIHAEKAKSLVRGAGGSRSWLGANAAVALGSVLEAEGELAEAERELAYAEHFFRDEVATVHHAWSLVLLARVRCRRGRLEEAEATLRAAGEAIAELADTGRVSVLVADFERELEQARTRARSGEVLQRPSEAELAVLRLLASDLSAREIGAKLFLSPNTVRSHTRALYRKLGVNSRAEAVARADALSLLGQTESPR
jgi:LuxR family transcriptional regulator, maltose regulon positive regulatory protein